MQMPESRAGFLWIPQSAWAFKREDERIITYPHICKEENSSERELFSVECMNNSKIQGVQNESRKNFNLKSDTL